MKNRCRKKADSRQFKVSYIFEGTSELVKLNGK